MKLSRLEKEVIKTPRKKIKSFWKSIGPGVITGASDDDPSGIATYSQAGASFGLATLWTALFTFPLMAAIQEMCARIGIVTSKGLVGNISEHYHKSVLYFILLLSFPAITINIGADIAGMGAASNLLVPQIPSLVFSTIFSILLIYSIIQFPYKKIVNIMKWLCMILLVYILVPFIAHVDWGSVLAAGITPKIQFTKEYLMMLVAILGTTISPYLFFWQSSMSLEDHNHRKHTIVIDKREMTDVQHDVSLGMFFSNLVMFFIILATGTVLFSGGIHSIETVEQAAAALKPLAGDLSSLLFAIGIIGTGFLAIPVLAGSLSYSLAERFGWVEGMDKKWHQAKGFYTIIAVSILIGLLINFLKISPMKALIYTAIIYGLISPFIIALILHMCNNKKMMGEYRNGWLSNTLGFAVLLLMTVSAVALFFI